MKTRIELIATPWADISTPSIQLGALQAHLDQCDIPDVTTTSYSAFLEVPYRVLSVLLFKWGVLQSYDEYLYCLALIKKFRPELLTKPGQTLEELIDILHQEPFFKTGQEKMLDERLLDWLIKASDEYIADKKLPSNDDGELRVYGFTMNYAQVHSSLYFAKTILQESKNKNVLFLFGGMSAAVPHVVELIADMGLPAYCVLGEGEKKLELIARACAKAATYEDAKRDILSCNGLFAVSDAPNLLVRDKSHYAGQFANLADLPIPDFREYLDVVRSINLDEYSTENFLAAGGLPIEGTRGCFAKCSFCGLNYMWSGFRKMSSDAIIERAEKQMSMYSTYMLKFMDNVCDTWIEGFADSVLERNTRIRMFLELRAHHPEVFWTKLALAGAEVIQVGVEGLSDNLMKLISKGTTVAQNILSQKYLTELNILSVSNLITFYPYSTPEDAEETKRVLEKTPHFQEYLLVPFAMVLGSPHYERLSEEERRRLTRRTMVNFPPDLHAYQVDFGFATPEGMVSPEATNAWSDLMEWHREFSRKQREDKPTLTCERLLDGSLRILDGRTDDPKVFIYRGADAEIYDEAHAGSSAEKIASKTGYPVEQVTDSLLEFESKGLVHLASGRWIALAIRNRDVVIQRYLTLERKAKVEASTAGKEQGRPRSLNVLPPTAATPTGCAT